MWQVPEYTTWNLLTRNEQAKDTGRRMFYTDELGETVPASDDEGERVVSACGPPEGRACVPEGSLGVHACMGIPMGDARPKTKRAWGHVQALPACLPHPHLHLMHAGAALGVQHRHEP